MFDYYLIAADEQSMVDTLTQLELLVIYPAIDDVDRNISIPERWLVKDNVTLDVIGPWYDVDELTQDVVKRDGYYFNVYSPEVIEWPEHIQVENPITPKRKRLTGI